MTSVGRSSPSTASSGRFHHLVVLIAPDAERACAAVGGVRTRSSGASERADPFARMPKPRIYVDTTIPSMYHSRRTDPKMVEWRAVTRQWWETAIHTCELLTSPAVLRELGRGRSNLVSKRLEMMEDLELLPPHEDVDRAAALYMRHKIMPADPEGDALHLALASYYECDVLVTWNYHHLANTNKLDRIKKLNVELGLFVPRILTPLDLMEEDHV